MGRLALVQDRVVSSRDALSQARVASTSRVAVDAFVPTDIAGLQLWLKADAGLYQDAAMATPAVADADPVGGWADQSGQNNHATQATADSRPLLKLAIQNGRPVVRFDGNDDHLKSAQVLASTTGLTVLIVAKHTAQSDYDGLYGQAVAGVVGGYNMGLTPTAPREQRGDIAKDPTEYIANGLATITNDIFFLRVLRWESGDNTRNFLNGNADGVSASALTGTLTPADALIVGALQWANALYTDGANLLNGDIAELLIYNSALSTANRQAVEAYLNSRWGVY